ncbi:AAA family ATPase [Kocuria soli]|uniref:AAA family ATPase n=1 Tax=Kocuria soli TaxID=2485125 RepID=UPI0018F3B583|nr:AAA family ATPase [Kocuria soli]
MTKFAETRPDPLDGAFNSDWLMGQSFPPVEYVVPGLIPEGLTLLTAAPKIGKSWMVLSLGYAAATGGLAFGKIPVQQRPVLYLALEDGQRRLQGRLRTIGVQDGHRLLTMMTSTPPGVSAVETIAAFLERHAGQRPMVVLDTLGKVRGVYTGNDAYQKDYGQMSALKDLVDAWPGTSLIVVHHTKKAGTADFLDSVSGTQGLAGAADSILVLRRDRHTQSAILNVTSRDAVEGEYAVTLTDGSWTLDGAAQAVQQREAVAGLGDQMTELVNLVGRYPEGIRRQELLTLMHMEPGTLDTYLRRAAEAGRIEKAGRGRYTPVRSVRSVSSEEPGAPNLTVLTQLTPTQEGATA